MRAKSSSETPAQRAQTQTDTKQTEEIAYPISGEAKRHAQDLLLLLRRDTLNYDAITLGIYMGMLEQVEETMQTRFDELIAQADKNSEGNAGKEDDVDQAGEVDEAEADGDDDQDLDQAVEALHADEAIEAQQINEAAVVDMHDDDDASNQENPQFAALYYVLAKLVSSKSKIDEQRAKEFARLCFNELRAQLIDVRKGTEYESEDTSHNQSIAQHLLLFACCASSNGLIYLALHFMSCDLQQPERRLGWSQLTLGQLNKVGALLSWQEMKIFPEAKTLTNILRLLQLYGLKKTRLEEADLASPNSEHAQAARRDAQQKLHAMFVYQLYIHISPRSNKKRNRVGIMRMLKTHANKREAFPEFSEDFTGYVRSLNFYFRRCVVWHNHENDPNERLQAAIRLNDEVLFYSALRDPSLAIDKKTVQGYTAVYMAALHNRVNFLQRLIAPGADVTLSCVDDATALHIAAIKGHTEVVRVLLEGDSTRDFLLSARTNKNQRTALHMAAFLGREEAVRALLDNDQTREAQLFTRDKQGYTALHLAIQKGDVNVVRELLANDDHRKALLAMSLEGLGFTALHMAVHCKQTDVVRVLLEQGADPRVTTRNENVETALHLAAASGDAATIHVLLRAKSQWATLLSMQDAYDLTPFERAGEYGMADAVYAMWEPYVSYLVDTNTITTPARVFHYLARRGQAGELAALFKSDKHKGALLSARDAHGRTILHALAQHDQPHVLELLFGFNIDDGECGYVVPELKVLLAVQDAQGQTALHIAASLGHTDVAEGLLACGLDPNIRMAGPGRLTALHLAATHGHHGVVEALRVHEADVGLRMADESRFTALHIAARRGDANVMNEMFSRKRHLRQALLVRSASGETALHLAVKAGHEAVVTFLLGLTRFDNKYTFIPPLLQARNARGLTALHIAAQNGSLAIVKTLLSLEHGREDLLCARDGDGNTALNIAEQGEHAEVAALLHETMALYGVKAETVDVVEAGVESDDDTDVDDDADPDVVMSDTRRAGQVKRSHEGAAASDGDVSAGPGLHGRSAKRARVAAILSGEDGKPSGTDAEADGESSDEDEPMHDATEQAPGNG